MLCDEARELEKAGEQHSAPGPQERRDACRQEETRCKIRVIFFLIFPKLPIVKTAFSIPGPVISPQISGSVKITGSR